MPGIENVNITKLDYSEVSSNNSQMYGTTGSIWNSFKMYLCTVVI